MTQSVRGFRTKILFVEGFHDRAFFLKLIEQLFGDDMGIQIVELGGMRRSVDFKRVVQALQRVETEAIGIVTDADEDARATYNNVLEHVRRQLGTGQARLDISPDGLLEEGSVGNVQIGERAIRFGIWIMPDNISQGQLEDFVLQMVPRSDVVRPHAKRYILSLPDSIVEPNSIRLSKHIAHAWLSAYYPGWGFSDALEGGQLDIDANVSELSKLKLWVGMLYSLL